jgi:hypothetical protein
MASAVGCSLTRFSIQLQKRQDPRMFELLSEGWRYLLARKKLWLLPVLVMSGIIGTMIVLAVGSVIAPFIYTLF